MAVLRAFEATDMRAELGFGIPVTADRFEIVIEAVTRTTTFRGDFFYPLGAVAKPLLHPVGFEALHGGVEGTLLGYSQERLGLTQYQVQGFELDAFAAFFALFRLDSTRLFERLVFADRDSLFGSRARDVLFGFGGNDQLAGFDGGDRLSGGAGTDTVYGERGDDVLSGGAGLDWLWGGDDDDRLLGDAAEDRLDGQSGDDVLVGGRAADELRGGTGADAFRFLAIADSEPGSRHRDVIRDFGGDDRIDLRPIDAVLEARGDQAFVFIGEGPFTGDAGQLRFEADGRLVQGDSDGDGEVDLEIELGGSAVPDATSFLL